METTKSIATDYAVPFRTREHLGALPTLAPIAVPVQGISVSAAGMGAPIGTGVRADAAFDLTTGDPSASCLASPL
ncbi:hypothetical protein [Knoellia subterranea]|uniref:Uncharacterized protein n=1 Tax=Knoellia subterranea KCTC 19937 TaxID=1385521 RepID=A0A0A0JQ97_9MICO|nr:hypothetical protein [Knoellia subterranea]KGN39620.1 hypothetical protein N803_02690 [Knoellia subterranea KCTC 19937]